MFHVKRTTQNIRENKLEFAEMQIGGWLNFNHLVFNYDKEGYPMSYTKAEEQSIRDNAPVTYETAELLASQFGKTVRSVVSKYVCLKAKILIASFIH